MMAVALPPGAPPAAAEEKPWKGQELLDQQARDGILAITERLGRLRLQAVTVTLQASAANRPITPMAMARLRPNTPEQSTETRG
jgi:hypothetical protein